MVLGKKVIVVMPAYNAEYTLYSTVSEIPMEVVDEVILVDDFSSDNTLVIANAIGSLRVFQHDSNRGYGANQKTCFEQALLHGADIVVLLHPDYQYTPKLIASMVHLVAIELYPVVFASRILGGGALRGGMPIYKYIANRLITAFQNLMMGQKLSEYHTGFRVYSKMVLEEIPFNRNSDDFVFDSQIIAQILDRGHDIAEITCPTNYFPEASSINFARSLRYGIGCLNVALQYRISKNLGLRPNYLKR